MESQELISNKHLLISAISGIKQYKIKTKYMKLVLNSHVELVLRGLEVFDRFSSISA